VYFDPPYDPVSKESNFTSYDKNGFGKEEQVRLRNCCISLNNQGIKFMLSNSNTPFIVELYKDFNITIVQAKRSINSNSKKRGKVEELIIRNYE